MNLHQKLQKNIGWLVGDGQLSPIDKCLTQVERDAFNKIPREHFTSHSPRFIGDTPDRFSVKPCDEFPANAISLAERLAYIPHHHEPGCDHALTVYVRRTVLAVAG